MRWRDETRRTKTESKEIDSTREEGGGGGRKRDYTLPIIIHVQAGGRVVPVRWWYASRLRTTTGPFARWRSESTVVRLAARGQAYARTAPFFTRLLSPVGGYRRWSAAGAGVGEHTRSHDCVRRTKRSCPRLVLASPLFFFLLTTCRARNLKALARLVACGSVLTIVVFSMSFHSIGNNTERSEAVRTKTDGELGNNDCNTADTCLDRRLRHSPLRIGQPATVAPTTLTRCMPPGRSFRQLPASLFARPSSFAARCRS